MHPVLVILNMLFSTLITSSSDQLIFDRKTFFKQLSRIHIYNNLYNVQHNHAQIQRIFFYMYIFPNYITVKKSYEHYQLSGAVSNHQSLK